MMIETRCFNVIIWGRIAAVGHIGQGVIVLGVVAPPPPPAVRREDNGMKPIPSHSTRSTVAWMVRVLIILIIQLQPAVQFTLAGDTAGPLLAAHAARAGAGGGECYARGLGRSPQSRRGLGTALALLPLVQLPLVLPFSLC